MKKPDEDIAVVDGKELSKLLEDAPVMIPAILVGAYIHKGTNENFPDFGEICTFEAILQVKDVGLAVMPLILDLELADSLGLKETPTIEEGN
jgi:hypothetical protein|tara:strand:+ start:347 stop:622 length:276 start_codon:yes stop_codon:yes gene_type:complete